MIELFDLFVAQRVSNANPFFTSQVNIDEKFFPSSEYRRRFLTKYLREFNKIQKIELSDEEFAAELDDLFHRVSLASALHILRWCVFAFLFDVNEDVSWPL